MQTFVDEEDLGSPFGWVQNSYVTHVTSVTKCGVLMS